MIEFVADPHNIADWDELRDSAPNVLVDVVGMVDEEGALLHLVIHDADALDSQGRPLERINFAASEPSQIAAFFRAVDDARRALPPNIVD
ncbi:MAG TPA: hypothetical protein VGD71_28660 [Kribbella sp.]|jgi:hypothetical protein